MIGRAIGAAAVLAACHSHPGFPNGPPDAPPPDTLTPTTADAPPDAVTVRVTDHGAPASGVAIYFQNADSSLVLGATTDANGTAGAVLAAGGYVTVIEPADASGVARLATFAATQPRDALALDIAPSDPADAIDVTIAVPSFVAATAYRINTSCGSLMADASGLVTGQLIDCGDTMDMIVLAGDANDAILGSFLATDLPVAGSSIMPITPLGEYAPLAPSQFLYSNAPASSPAIRTLTSIATPRGTLFEASTSGPLSDGAATNAIALPAAPSALGITISDMQPGDSDHGEQRVLDWGPPSPQYTLDVAGALLPAYDEIPTYDPATRTVRWTERSIGAPPDLVRTRIHAFRDAIPEGKSWTWELVAPRGAATAIAFPKFPPGDFDFTPGASDAFGVDELTTARLPLGYDGARAHGFADLQAQITGPSGRIVVEDLYTPPL